MGGWVGGRLGGRAGLKRRQRFPSQASRARWPAPPPQTFHPCHPSVEARAPLPSPPPPPPPPHPAARTSATHRLRRAVGTRKFQVRYTRSAAGSSSWAPSPVSADMPSMGRPLQAGVCACERGGGGGAGIGQCLHAQHGQAAAGKERGPGWPGWWMCPPACPPTHPTPPPPPSTAPATLRPPNPPTHGRHTHAPDFRQRALQHRLYRPQRALLVLPPQRIQLVSHHHQRPPLSHLPGCKQRRGRWGCQAPHHLRPPTHPPARPPTHHIRGQGDLSVGQPPRLPPARGALLQRLCCIHYQRHHVHKPEHAAPLLDCLRCDRPLCGGSGGGRAVVRCVCLGTSVQVWVGP